MACWSWRSPYSSKPTWASCPLSITRPSWVTPWRAARSVFDVHSRTPPMCLDGGRLSFPQSVPHATKWTVPRCLGCWGYLILLLLIPVLTTNCPKRHDFILKQIWQLFQSLNLFFYLIQPFFKKRVWNHATWSQLCLRKQMQDHFCPDFVWKQWTVCSQCFYLIDYIVVQWR